MQVAVFPIGRLMANCCVAYEEDSSAIVVDPGGEPSRIISFLKEKGLICRAILLTHGHNDHTEGVSRLREITGAPVYIGAGDAYRLDEAADVLLSGGEKLNFGMLAVEAIPSPGHTEGGMCYLSGGILFSGDTLFRESVGRTDFPGGDWDTLQRSLSALVSRFSDSSVTVVPGHGETTDLKHELEYNPFL